VNPAIFREYDIRGVAEADFDADFALLLGKAHGTAIVEKGGSRVAVGRDCRATSDAYAEAVIAGLMAAGLHVFDIGACASPLLYFSLFHLDLDGGIQVTASHNPAEYNGFKICLGKETLYGAEIQDLRARMENARFCPAGRGRREHYDIAPAYQKHLLSDVRELKRPLKVVIDAGNGMGGPVAPPLFRRLGCTVWEIACTPDGRFPLHHPDPTVPENLGILIDKVHEEKADIGIAYDGDADRIGAVDENGRIIWGDELLVLFARDVLARNPGAVVISEVKCSQRLFDDVARHNGTAIMWKSGHSVLKAKMKETQALLAGEMTGHIFFKERYFGYDDAVYASLRLVEILARSERPLSALLQDLPNCVATPELRVACPDDKKFIVAERATEFFRRYYDVIDIDGVRVKFADGWGLIRASNTQPALVLRFEASTVEKLDEYRAIMESKLKELADADLDCSNPSRIEGKG
jgi:phosphomannomutase / phosphoglucomutase